MLPRQPMNWLQITGIGASFVVTPLGADVLLSARSVGDINVQVILEKLGGGGNANAAGGTVKDAKVADVRLQLLAATMNISNRELRKIKEMRIEP